MQIQFGKIIRDQKERLLAAFRPIAIRGCNIRFYVPTGFIHRFREQRNVFVRALDIVKRRFGFLAHVTPSDRPPVAVGLAGLIRFHLFCHKTGGRQQLLRAIHPIRKFT